MRKAAEELALDFDCHDATEYHEDTLPWWYWLDQDMQIQEELDRIERQAEIEDYRLNGYGE